MMHGLIDADALLTTKLAFDDAKSVTQAIIDGSQPTIKADMLPNG